MKTFTLTTTASTDATTVATPNVFARPIKVTNLSTSQFTWSTKLEPTKRFNNEGEICALVREKESILGSFSVTVTHIQETGTFDQSGKPHVVAICKLITSSCSEILSAQLLAEFGIGDSPNIWVGENDSIDVKLTPGFSCVERRKGSIVQACKPNTKGTGTGFFFYRRELPSVGTLVKVIVVPNGTGKVTYLWVRPRTIAQKKRVAPATPKPVQRELATTPVSSVASPATARPVRKSSLKPKTEQQTIAHQSRSREERLSMPRPKTLDGITQGEQMLFSALVPANLC